MDKRQLQLGMNPSTAAHRLRMDLLFNFVVAAGHKCHRCGQPLQRETFSVEHKTPWLDSEDPKGTFFDPENIAYSHFACNSGAARKYNKHPDPVQQKADRTVKRAAQMRSVYTKERRQERYLATGH